MSRETPGGIFVIIAFILIVGLVVAGAFAITEGKKAALQIQTQKTEQIRLEIEKTRAKEEAKLQLEELKVEAEKAEQEMKFDHELQVMRTQLDELWERQVLFEHNLILLAQVQQGGSAEEIEAVLDQLEPKQKEFQIDWLVLIIGTVSALLAFWIGLRYFKTNLKGLFDDTF